MFLAELGRQCGDLIELNSRQNIRFGCSRHNHACRKTGGINGSIWENKGIVIHNFWLVTNGVWHSHVHSPPYLTQQPAHRGQWLEAEETMTTLIPVAYVCLRSTITGHHYYDLLLEI